VLKHVCETLLAISQAGLLCRVVGGQVFTLFKGLDCLHYNQSC